MAENKRKTRTSPVGRREMVYLFSLCALLAIALVLVLIFGTAGNDAEFRSDIAAWAELPAIEDTSSDEGGFGVVRQDSQYVADAYYELLERAQDPQVRPEPVGASFHDLATRPSEFRGKAVEVRGRVLDIEPHRLLRASDSLPQSTPERPIDFVYQTELVVMQAGTDSIVAKYFLHTIRPPEGFEPGDEAVFRGYFYARYLGKIVEMRATPESEGDEAGSASIIAPLIVGADLLHADRRRIETPSAFADLAGVGGIVDRDAEVSNAAVEAALRRLDEGERVESGGFFPASYFDCIERPDEMRGRLLVVKGEVLSVERYAAGASFRRMMVRADYGGPFRRLFAVFLGPGAAQVDVGETVLIEGAFVELLKVRGATQAEQIVPVVVARDFTKIRPERSSSVSTGFWLLIAALLAITAVAGALFVLGLLRAKRKKID